MKKEGGLIMRRVTHVPVDKNRKAKELEKRKRNGKKKKKRVKKKHKRGLKSIIGKQTQAERDTEKENWREGKKEEKRE